MQKSISLLCCKKIGNLGCMLSFLLGLACKQVPIASTSDQASKPKPLLDYRFLGSISCLEGKKNMLVLQRTGVHTKSLSKGLIAVIGLKNDSQLKPSMVNEAGQSHNKTQQFLWQANGDFIYWHKVDDSGTDMLQVAEEDYNKLVAHTYNLYMAYMPQDGSALCHTTTPTPLSMQPLPSSIYRQMQLQALDCRAREKHNDSWLLEGSIATAIANAKMGFLLVKDGADPYELVSHIIRTKETWPTEQPTLFNDALLVVPGVLRKQDLILEGKFLNHQTPIKSGNFKIICYLKQGNHFYLSQLAYLSPDADKDSLVTSRLPTLDTGDSYNVQTLDLTVCREEVSGHTKAIRFSDFKIQYTLNNRMETPDLQPCLLLFPKNTIWNSVKLEALFQKLQEAHCVVTRADDIPLCLVTSGCKTLDPSCIDFFNKETDYQFSTCLFSKTNKRLIHSTNPQTLKIETKEIAAPVKVEVKPKIKNQTHPILEKALYKTAAVFDAIPNRSIHEVIQALDQVGEACAKIELESSYKIAQALDQAIEAWKENLKSLENNKKERLFEEIARDATTLAEAFKSVETAAAEAREIATACKEATKVFSIIATLYKAKAACHHAEAENNRIVKEESRIIVEETRTLLYKTIPQAAEAFKTAALASEATASTKSDALKTTVSVENQHENKKWWHFGKKFK